MPGAPYQQLIVMQSKGEQELVNQAFDSFIDRNGLRDPQGNRRTKNDWLRGVVLRAARRERSRNRRQRG